MTALFGRYGKRRKQPKPPLFLANGKLERAGAGPNEKWHNRITDYRVCVVAWFIVYDAYLITQNIALQQLFSVIWVAIDVNRPGGDYAKYFLETQPSKIIKTTGET